MVNLCNTKAYPGGTIFEKKMNILWVDKNEKFLVKVLIYYQAGT